MNTAYQSSNDDPFSGGSKTPSLSWKGVPVGSVFTLKVLEPAKLLQSRNFDTNQPDYWDPEKTQPKMSAVVNVHVVAGPHSVGEDRSIWAQKPSSLFVAIADAQRAAGAMIAAGGTLHLKFDSETPHTNTRYNAIKNYLAKYEPPAGQDAFAPVAPVRVESRPQPHPAGPMGWPPPKGQPALPGTATASSPF